MILDTEMRPAEADTTLRGRWLLAARMAWFVVFTLVVGLTLFNIPFQLAHGQVVCSGAACPGDQLSPADMAQLQQVGLSPGFYAIYQVALSTIVSLVFLIVGGLIFWRMSNDWFGIFTAITLALAAVNLTTGGSGALAVLELYPALHLPVQILIVIGGVATSLYFYLFPDGHFAPRWIVWLVPLVIVHAALAVFRPDLLGNDWYWFAGNLTIIFALIYRFRRVSTTLQRQQTKWVVFGTSLAFAGILSVGAYFTFVYPGGQPTGAALLIAVTLFELCILLIPISIGMAILRSHLWDIDILIRRTLIYSVLTGLLALVYLGVVLALQALFTALTGQQRSELVTVISTLAIAALFVPLRGRVQAIIDRRFYRRKYDAARTLAEFGGALRDEVNLDDVTAHLLTAVDETMQPAAVSLWLARNEGPLRGTNDGG